MPTSKEHENKAQAFERFLKALDENNLNHWD